MADDNAKSYLTGMISLLRSFGAANYESDIKIQKFKMADTIWLTKMQKHIWIGWIFVLGDFW